MFFPSVYDVLELPVENISANRITLLYVKVFGTLPVVLNNSEIIAQYLLSGL